MHSDRTKPSSSTNVGILPSLLTDRCSELGFPKVAWTMLSSRPFAFAIALMAMEREFSLKWVSKANDWRRYLSDLRTYFCCEQRAEWHDGILGITKMFRLRSETDERARSVSRSNSSDSECSCRMRTLDGPESFMMHNGAVNIHTLHLQLRQNKMPSSTASSPLPSWWLAELRQHVAMQFKIVCSWGAKSFKSCRRDTRICRLPDMHLRCCGWVTLLSCIFTDMHHSWRVSASSKRPLS